MRKEFHVVPATTPHGTDWHVKFNGKVLTSHTLKEKAVESGVAYAIANQPSELFIHNSLGQIEDRRTYGSDPFPPRG